MFIVIQIHIFRVSADIVSPCALSNSVKLFRFRITAQVGLKMFEDTKDNWEVIINLESN